ncbi:glycosyl transferase family 1 [Aliidongia dinghuensis]|uniref:Glycosyl transferase family 1 n=2 Tax=Aliidongia dinghuensis TaxID=1867774 RepID=A0A8J3E6V8_9PROT|nr:glycosyl transferase family 1 [Aliidongia dinghuensis]
MPARQKTLIYVVTEDWYFWLHRLAIGQAALAAGYRVFVCARVQAHREILEQLGFTVVALPWRRGGGPLLNEIKTLWMLWRLFRRERPDIVHSIALKAIIYGGLMARLAGVRARVSTVAGLGYVFTSQRLKARVLRRPVLLALALGMRGPDALVTLENPDDGDRLAAGGAMRQSQVALVCSCGVDTDRFAPKPEPDGVPIVAMACRLVRDKGPAVAVAAMRRLKAEGVPIRFLLAGGTDKGSADSHTKEEVESWVAEGLVEWVGHISDVVSFWQGCHMAVYPSRYGEGVPKTLLEAASCGRPVVTTDMPGCREALVDGETGFLVPVDDDAAVAARLKQLALDPELRRRMGQAARAKALAEFADARVQAGMLDTYRRVLAL